MDEDLGVVFRWLGGHSSANHFIVDDLDHVEAKFRLDKLAVISGGVYVRTL